MRIKVHCLFLALSLLGMMGIAQAASVMVGCDEDFVPFEFKHGDSYTGFDIELWDAAARQLRLKYTLKPMPFEKLIPALKAGQIDVALAGMTVTAEREKSIDFSYPYFDAGLLLMVKQTTDEINGIEDLKGKTVATKKGTTAAEFVSSLKMTGVSGGNIPTYETREMIFFPTINEAFAALQKGQADAVIFDSPVILYHLTAQDGSTTMKTVGPLYKRQSYGIAFPQGSDLREKVSVALLDMMEDGRYNKIYKKWFGYLKDRVAERSE
ncbi:MAG: transporter substrate-binding domain-containing protein [Spartobacteria bacterium]|nr:transporter substrate-binding domain-containing protein [Spartobacteria bacterium]